VVALQSPGKNVGCCQRMEVLPYSDNPVGEKTRKRRGERRTTVNDDTETRTRPRPTTFPKTRLAINLVHSTDPARKERKGGQMLKLASVPFPCTSLLKSVKSSSGKERERGGGGSSLADMDVRGGTFHITTFQWRSAGKGKKKGSDPHKPQGTRIIDPGYAAFSFFFTFPVRQVVREKKKRKL